MLKLENLSNFILKDINFEVKKWEIFVVMGHNWSWKTTLLKTIIWLEKANKWKIFFEWKDITNLSIYDRAKLWIWYIMQQIPDYIWIKVQQYVKGILKDKFGELVVENKFKELWLNREFYKDRYFDSNLSWWEKKKIEIIVTFLLNKKIYLLDEIETSLDATSLQIVKKRILDMKSNWKSFIIVSHTSNLLDLWDRWMILCNWKIDSYWDVKKLLKKYLGKCLCCNKCKKIWRTRQSQTI